MEKLLLTAEVAQICFGITALRFRLPKDPLTPGGPAKLLLKTEQEKLDFPESLAGTAIF
jgi:hypothetical protein